MYLSTINLCISAKYDLCIFFEFDFQLLKAFHIAGPYKLKYKLKQAAVVPVISAAWGILGA